MKAPIEHLLVLGGAIRDCRHASGLTQHEWTERSRQVDPRSQTGLRPLGRSTRKWSELENGNNGKQLHGRTMWLVDATAGWERGTTRHILRTGEVPAEAKPAEVTVA